jgi:hypothetical protein
MHTDYARTERPSLDSHRFRAAAAAVVVASPAVLEAAAALEAVDTTHLVVLVLEAVVVLDVSSISPTFVALFPQIRPIADSSCIDMRLLQLPYTVGWQDLKDLFRQASKSYSPSDQLT